MLKLDSVSAPYLKNTRDDDEIVFDDFAKTIEASEDSCSFATRASFIPGLLSLKEVDLILRGQFKPPFESSTSTKSDVLGGCFTNITPSGTKKVRRKQQSTKNFIIWKNNFYVRSAWVFAWGHFRLLS